VRDVFADEYALAKTDKARCQLAQRMLKIGVETEDALEQYAVLRAARDLAVEASNVNLVEELIDEMALRFEIDGLQMKSRTLLDMVRNARSAEARRNISRRGAALLSGAIKSEDISVAAGLAEAWGPSIRGTADRKLMAQFLAVSKQIEKLQKEYAYVYHWYGMGGTNNCYASRNFVYVRCVHDRVKGK